MDTEKNKKKEPVREQVQRVSTEQIIIPVNNPDDFKRLVMEAQKKAYEAKTAAQNTEPDNRYPDEMLSLNQEINQDLEEYDKAIAAVSAGTAEKEAIKPTRSSVVPSKTAEQVPQKLASPAEISAATQEFDENKIWEIMEKGGAIQPKTPEEREIPPSIQSAMGANAVKEQKGKDQEKIIAELNSRYDKAVPKNANEFPRLLTFIQEMGEEAKTAQETDKPLYEEYLLKASQVLRVDCEKVRNQLISKFEKLKKFDPADSILPDPYINLISKAILTLEKQYNSDFRNSHAVKDENDEMRVRMEKLETEKIALYSLLDRAAVRNMAAMLEIDRDIFKKMDTKLKSNFSEILKDDPGRKTFIIGSSDTSEYSRLIAKWKKDQEDAYAAGLTNLAKKLENNMVVAKEILFS